MSAAARIRVLAMTLCAVALAYAPPSWCQAPRDAGQGYSFAFQDAPIEQAVQEVFSALGVPFIIDPSVSGRISFRIERRLTKPQLLQALETALAANNVALVRDGETMVVTGRAKARGATGVRASGEAARGGYEVVAAPLSYAVASEVAKALEAIAGRDSVIYADDKLGLLILGGSGAELDQALETIKIFDQSRLQSANIRWFELSQASAASVAAELEAMLKAAGIGGVTVAPLKRLNGVILFGRTAAALDEVAQWVIRLDTPVRDTAASLWIYRPRNTTAEALSRTLSAATSDRATVETQADRPPSIRSANNAPETAGETTILTEDGSDGVRTSFDKATNTLLVSAPAWRWVQIQKILAELDRPQAQLMIAATILEVTLSNDFRLGVDWSILGASGKLTATSTSGSSSTIRPTFPGLSITYLDTDIQAAISALGARTSLEVVSAPKILTLDNHTARLQVGDQVPVVTRTAQGVGDPGAPLVSTVDYRNSGVILNVTPRISGDDRIVVEVSQEVSSVTRTESSGIDSPTIQQRQLESTLVLQDGGVVALGGLISRSRDRGQRGVPLAQSIPGLGALFRTSSNDTSRTELIVLLSARIIRDQAAADQALESLKADMRELQARGLFDAP